MIYLKEFTLLNNYEEFEILSNKKNIYNTIYPFKIFTSKQLEKIEFDPITIFYGGNGSGKTTLLNIISDKLLASKKNVNNKGDLFYKYADLCKCILENRNECKEIKFISSDDVFDYLLDIRAINSKVNRRKDELSKEYMNYKNNDQTISFDDYENLKKQIDASHLSESKYIRSRLTSNDIIMHSNGESALEFWENEIKDNSIYILDEPENSLSAENQLKLKQFIEESTRFYNCQFIISTHSPFILSLQDAKIYDLDEIPVINKKWTELKNIRTYYEFFKESKIQFEDNI